MFDLHEAEFWVLVAFVIFVVLAGRTIWKLATSTLDARAQRIREEIAAAEKLREDAQAALAQYQRRQKDALKEAQDIIAAARDEAARIRAHAVTETEQALKRREQQALEKIAQAEGQALQQVRDLAVEVAIAATGKLLEQRLDAARGEALIDQAIADLPGKIH